VLQRYDCGSRSYGSVFQGYIIQDVMLRQRISQSEDRISVLDQW
jgi:hypothetical protein